MFVGQIKKIVNIKNPLTQLKNRMCPNIKSPNKERRPAAKINN
jgi:hypothetical protein